MDAEKTGKLIASVRGERGLTQQQLAQQLHISHTTVSKWERGSGFPDVSLIEPLSQTLDLTVAELFQGERREDAAMPDLEDLLTDVVQASQQEMRRKWRAGVTMLLGCVAVVLALIFFSPHPMPKLRGFYQSEFCDRYCLQLSVSEDDNNSFVQYINNCVVNEGTWTAGKDGRYHLQGDHASFWLVLSEEDSFLLSTPGIRDGEPILLENIEKIPVYFDSAFSDRSDREEYRQLLNP